MPLSQYGNKDSLIWHHTKNGVYSVRSGYHIAVQDSSKEKVSPSSSFIPHKKLWPVIWKLDIPHKVRHFWWRACSNSLATKENLVRRRCGISNMCPICGNYEESIEHLLFDCSWARSVWFGCSIQLNMGYGLPNSVLRWTSQVVEALKGNHLLNFLGKVVMIGWQICKSRNDFVFNSNPVDPEATMRRAIEALCEFSGLRIPSLIHRDNPTAEDASSHWRAPDQGGLKINCDVAIKRNGRDAKCAAVIRDSRGAIVDGRVVDAEIASSLHGELLAVRIACGMVKTMGLHGVTIESDNQTAIKLSVSELVPPWEVMAVVWDIRKLCLEEEISCAWCKREANGLAHEVASEGLRGVLPVNWVSSPSPCLVSIVTRDISLSQ